MVATAGIGAQTVVVVRRRLSVRWVDTCRPARH